MSAIISRLCEDHRNVDRLLDVFERKIDALDKGSADVGDVELMCDIMSYMTRFPDRTHHPMEDLIFERLRARGLAPQTEETIEKLLHEHVALAKKGEALRAMLLREHAALAEKGKGLRRLEHGSKSERQTLAALGRDYAEFLRYHTRLEERTVFVEAETLLDDTDWSDIARAFEASDDPVFGPVVDRGFRALYRHIQNNAWLTARRTD